MRFEFCLDPFLGRARPATSEQHVLYSVWRPLTASPAGGLLHWRSLHLCPQLLGGGGFGGGRQHDRQHDRQLAAPERPPCRLQGPAARRDGEVCWLFGDAAFGRLLLPLGLEAALIVAGVRGRNFARRDRFLAIFYDLTAAALFPTISETLCIYILDGLSLEKD